MRAIDYNEAEDKVISYDAVLYIAGVSLTVRHTTTRLVNISPSK